MKVSINNKNSIKDTEGPCKFNKILIYRQV